MLYEKIRLSDTDDRVYLECYTADEPEVCDGLLVIPGGGYAGVCADREGEPIALAFLGRGVNCFVLHYTVAPDGIFPVQLIEASRAMRHIRENAERYHVDPSRIFVTGFSAGGHLAASLGTLWHLDEVRRAVGGAEGINRPTGMILCYAVLTAFSEAHAHKGSFYNLLGTKTPSDEALKAVSIEYHVDERTCPAFIMHTFDDRVVPVGNALLMGQAMAKAGISCEMHIYPHAPHGVALGNAMTDRGSAAWNDPAIASWTDSALYWMQHTPSLSL